MVLVSFIDMFSGTEMVVGTGLRFDYMNMELECSHLCDLMLVIIVVYFKLEVLVKKIKTKKS